VTAANTSGLLASIGNAIMTQSEMDIPDIITTTEGNNGEKLRIGQNVHGIVAKHGTCQALQNICNAAVTAGEGSGSIQNLYNKVDDFGLAVKKEKTAEFYGSLTKTDLDKKQINMRKRRWAVYEMPKIYEKALIEGYRVALTWLQQEYDALDSK